MPVHGFDVQMGTLLRQERLARQMTQAEVSTLSDLESGRNTRFESVVRLAMALGPSKRVLVSHGCCQTAAAPESPLGILIPCSRSFIPRRSLLNRTDSTHFAGLCGTLDP